MKPKSPSKKQRLSSPRPFKGKSPSKEKALARWGDGLYYIVNILPKSEAKTKYAVQFEDRSESIVLPKDILREKKIGLAYCHICGVPEGQNVAEAFVECSSCERSYHAMCHKPVVSIGEGKDFVCRICVFAACAQPGGAKKRGDLTEKFKSIKQALPYDLRYLTWDASHVSNVEQLYCYCGGPGHWFNKMLQCCRCRQWFHEACIHANDEELMIGDRFYMFACSVCNKDEFIKRMEMTWFDIASVALFHLMMTFGSKYVDLEEHLVPFIKTNLESFGLTKLHLDGRHGQAVIIRQELLKVLSKTSVFCCGSEIKKKSTWYGLRERIPPTPPHFTVPAQGLLSEASLLDMGGDQKTVLVTPVKFAAPVPYIYKGSIKNIPPTQAAKVKVNKLEMMSKEHSPNPTFQEEPTSEEVVSEEVSSQEKECPPSPTPPAEIDDNNNSPVKQVENVSNDDDKFVSIKPAPSRDLFRSVQNSDVPNKPAVLEKSEFNVRTTKWNLNLAIPPPPNFSGPNHPFLTHFEQDSLRRQKKHFQEELTRLATMSHTKPQLDSNDLCVGSIPELDALSPAILAKGFNGELTGLLEQQSPAIVEVADKTSPDEIGSTLASIEKNENEFYKSGSPDSKMNGFKILDVIKRSPRTHLKEIIAETGLPPNGEFGPDAIDDLSFPDKHLKTLNRHLKHLSPTCGFKFPILDQTLSLSDNSPSKAVIPPVLDLNTDPVAVVSPLTTNPKRGQKRRHSSLDNGSKSAHSNRRSSSRKTTSTSGAEENVRRSSRSRRDVKRFEATLDNSFDGLARPSSAPTDGSLEQLYDVLSLRSSADGTVQYLVSWAQ